MIKLNTEAHAWIRHEFNNTLAITTGNLAVAIQAIKANDGELANKSISACIDAMERFAGNVRDLEAYVVDDKDNEHRATLESHIEQLKAAENTLEELRCSAQEQMATLPRKMEI